MTISPKDIEGCWRRCWVVELKEEYTVNEEVRGKERGKENDRRRR